DAKRFEDGGRDVDGVAELMPHLAWASQSLGPVHDERVPHAAAMRILLVPFERAVAGLGPSPWNVAVTVGAADVIETLHGIVHVLGHAIEVEHFIEYAACAALLACAVVRQQHEQGVIPGAK